MTFDAGFGRVRALSDDELLAGLSRLLGSSRRVAALVVAHLGEVEERRLHLLAGCESMFAYCTRRLRMSEDEACRRIEVARLARRFPTLFERLASGRLSLSVAALLKARLTESNHAALLDALSGKTVRQAGEVLAEWFPQPDVPPSIRKLPKRRYAGETTRDETARHENTRSENTRDETTRSESPSLTTTPLTSTSAHAAVEPSAARAAPPTPAARETPSVTSAPEATGTTAGSGPAAAPSPSGLAGVTGRVEAPAGFAPTSVGGPASRDAVHPTPRTARPMGSVQPLSPARYKVTFTASAELKAKLDLARDLLRHAVPSGDLATLVDRAFDLLIETTLKRRFAKRPGTQAGPSKPWAERHSEQPAAHAPDGGGRLGGTGDQAAAASPDITATRDDADAPTRSATADAKRADRSESSPHATADAKRADRSESSPHATADAKRSDRSEDSPHTTATRCAPRAETVQPTRRGRRLPDAVRRAVLERDGLRCTWQGPDGARCESRAWLEHDHVIPRGLGGPDDPANIRIRCRAHNQLAAELAYGQPAMTRIIAQKRARARPQREHGAPSPAPQPPATEQPVSTASSEPAG